MLVVIGIDPGKDGGMAVIRPGHIATLHPFEDFRHALDCLEQTKEFALGYRCHAFLELVHSMPRDGSASAFKFGKNAGGWEVALQAVGIPFDLVSPHVWQKAIGVVMPRGKTLTRTERKRRLKEHAQRLFPRVEGARISNKTADALLIAEYGWKRSGGDQVPF